MSFCNPDNSCPLCCRLVCGCTDDDIDMAIEDGDLIWGVINGKDWLLPPDCFPEVSDKSVKIEITITINQSDGESDDV